MKKIIISLSVISAVAALAIVGTVAFFSDTETSTGNVLQAGNLDLKVDSTCTYNGQPVQGCTWLDKDLTRGDLFFNFTDVKPGDSGEDTISLTAIDNDAYLCGYVQNLTNRDHGCNEPERKAEVAAYGQGNATCDGVGEGELQDAIIVKIWRDVSDQKNARPCDNVWQPEELVLYEGPINGNNGVWPLGQLKGNEKTCLGLSWNVPNTVGNIIQSDSVTGDIGFYVEQVRNNGQFHCPTTLPVEPVPAP